MTSPTTGPNSCTCATTRAGCTPNAGGTCVAARAFSTRCVTRRRIDFVATYRSGEPMPAASPWKRSRDGASSRQRRTDRSARVRCGSRSTASRTAGYAGDTLASALLANGVQVFGRSFKYHRPRGLLAAGSEEPNALVNVTRDAGRSTPNLRATQVEIYDGLVAEARIAGRRSASTCTRSTTCCRRCCPPRSTTRRSCGRAPRGIAVRAGHPPRRGPRT